MRYPKKERADRADRTVPIATASRDQTKQSANRAASEKHYARSSSLRDILVERAWASQAINALDSLGESPILNYATKPLQVEIQSLIGQGRACLGPQNAADWRPMQLGGTRIMRLGRCRAVK
jgi:hypothetical protein